MSTLEPWAKEPRQGPRCCRCSKAQPVEPWSVCGRCLTKEAGPIYVTLEGMKR